MDEVSGRRKAQRDWFAVYRQLARAEHESETTILRHTLQRLSVRISTHPYWASLPGTAPAAPMELKQVAWEAVCKEAGAWART
ncbi:hypothetical protein ACWGCW_37995 [Streptomyces sp. NPDC054933]